MTNSPSPPPRIMVLEDLPETRAMSLLQELSAEGAIELVSMTPEYSEYRDLASQVQPAIRSCNAIVCRPSRTGHITTAALEGTPDPFFVATLSKGSEHIEISNLPNVHILNSTGDANAPAVAELALSFAQSLLRPWHKAAAQMRLGNFDNRLMNSSRRLEGLTWLAIGAGAQVRQLVRHLPAWSIKSITAYHPAMDLTRLRGCAPRSKIENPHESSLLTDDAQGLSIALPYQVELRGTRDLNPSLSVADIVSLHVPLTPDTYHLINSRRLQSIKDNAILINVCRGDVVDEHAILEALRLRKLAGYASDVLNAKAENTNDFQESPLWREYVDPESSLNILLTPHLGGTTIDALEEVSREVLHDLLSALGLQPGFYERLSRENIAGQSNG